MVPARLNNILVAFVSLSVVCKNNERICNTFSGKIKNDTRNNWLYFERNVLPWWRSDYRWEAGFLKRMAFVSNFTQNALKQFA